MWKMFYFLISAPVTNAPVTPKALSAGQKRTHPAHIPSHFPEFPDPHTYIKTPVSQNFSTSSWRSLESWIVHYRSRTVLKNKPLKSFSSCRLSENPCQTTKWWERKQQLRGETWNEHLHASLPRLEKLKAYSKMTSLPSHVSDSQ